jgi:hypothetical protein
MALTELDVVPLPSPTRICEALHIFDQRGVQSSDLDLFANSSNASLNVTGAVNTSPRSATWATTLPIRGLGLIADRPFHVRFPQRTAQD